jgi:formylglycine-generating enzyme required for sulfatase activity
MKKPPVQLVLSLFAVFCLIALPLQAEAKKEKVQSEKEAVILLPLVVSAEAQSMVNEMQAAVVQGLQQKYKVYSGDRVLQELKKATDKENHRAKHDCDETRCLQDIATAFQTENVAVVHINKREGGYLLSLSIKAVISNEAVFDNSLPCEGCNEFKVVEKLKELSGSIASVSSAPAPEAPPAKVNLSDPETALWEEAKKGNAEEDYQAYLTTYPKGKYAPLAKTKLARLKEEARAQAVQQDQQAWTTAQQGSSQESYAAYLSLYPQGQFAALAQGRIDKVKREAATAEATQRREQTAAEAKRKQEQTAEAERQKREAGKGPAMVRIPGKNYEIGKYDVTQKEWQAIMGSNPSHFTTCGENCPVENVNWNAVHEFIQKLNDKTGRQYRLPIEEEWEYACYGGSQTEYCGGSNSDGVAWYSDNSNSTTHPVGQKQANVYGLYDMSGNVWQWMENEFEGGRAVRGGSWVNNSNGLLAAHRFGNFPARREGNLGFRLARTLP